MACACRGGKRAGTTTPSGAKIQGYQVTFPDGSVSGLFLTPIEAKTEVRRAGGGTIRQITG